jgi:phosphopantothenoylcysteine decarboxylase/phosphopantothenate--cysteine ligase
MSRTIILGVTGSIAAYKSAELVSMLVKRGYTVHVIMTPAAVRFITPLTLQTLSQNPVYFDMFATPGSWEIGHVSLAGRADLILVAPATADFIGRLAAGLADDLLAATIMATRAPVLLAPAMNEGMYANRVLQDKITYLKSRGYHFIDPDEGRLACGSVGRGRLADLGRIMTALERMLPPHPANRDLAGAGRPAPPPRPSTAPRVPGGPGAGALAGKRILVTAGPTREPLDPVRYISNYSSGKMGYAIAEAARERGAAVTLVSGPTLLEPPPGVELVPVETSQEMLEAVVGRFQQVEAVVMAAAVADFRPRSRSPHKIKKQASGLVLELETTPDILGCLGEQKQEQILVGFAAETEDLLANARAKLQSKHLDLVVANNLSEPGAGFGVDTNLAILLYSSGEIKKLPLMSKRQLADVLLDSITSLFKT